MKGLFVSIITVAGLLPVSFAATHYKCSNPRSRWDYWWYSASQALMCPPGSPCRITGSHEVPISWSVTRGDPIEYRVAEEAAKQFDGSYTYTAGGTWEDTGSHEVAAGTTQRLWLKQWYVVSDLDCVACTDIDTCSKDPHATTTWTPCTDRSCAETETSDANVRCDSGNHCTP